MRIGIDARFLTHPQAGGFKTYTTNLITGISQVDQENQYVIYLDREPTDADVLPEVSNFTYRVVPLRFSAIGMPFREQIDLVRQLHKDELDLAHFLCNTAPVNFKQKFVLTLHDVIQVADETEHTFQIRRNLNNHRRWMINSYSKWAILKSVGNAERILTVSNYERGKISRQLKIPPERISVTHLAPNAIFKPMNQAGLAAARTQLCADFGICERFIFGLGYEQRKNIPLLIEAFAAIANNYPDLVLVVVAANEAKQQQFKQIAFDRGLGERVKILGHCSPEALNRLYNLASVFVFPSNRESFGLPPLEAISCGTPTIALNGSSLPEILGDGALLVDGVDVDDWSSALQSVLNNHELQTDLVKRGLERANQMSWKDCAEKTISVYKTVHLDNADQMLSDIRTTTVV